MINQYEQNHSPRKYNIIQTFPLSRLNITTYMKDQHLWLIYLQEEAKSKRDQIIITTLKDDNSLSKEATFENNCRNLSSIAFFEHEDIFYTSSWNGAITVWKLIANKWYCVKTYDFGGILIFQLSIKGKTLVSLDSNDIVTIYNCQPITGELVQIKQINEIDPISNIRLNTNMLAICGFNGTVVLYKKSNTNLWKQFQEISFAGNSDVSASFCPVSDFLAIIDPNNSLSIWQKKDKYHPFQKFNDQQQIKFAEFSQDGKLFVTGCSKNSINIWEFQQNWIVKQQIFSKNNICKAIFQGGSEYLIIYGKNCQIYKSVEK